MRTIVALAALATLGLARIAVADDTGPCVGPAQTAGTITREALIEKWRDADSKFVTLDGVAVHYKDQGQGPPILLVHGTFGDLNDWNGWVAALVDKYRVIRLDLPAFGLTGEVPSGNYSIERFHTLVDGLMDHLGIERFAIVGTSYGGLVAFRYAATRTERITGLVLMNSAGIEYGSRRGRVEPPRDPNRKFVPKAQTREETEALMRRFINKPETITPELLDRKTDFANAVRRDYEGFVGVGHYERGNPERVLSHVRAPVLILWGGASNALSPETADAFRNALVKAKSIDKFVYDGGGHLMHVERPAETVRDARRFFDRRVRWPKR
jgi:pimeloyl-ACP methyl ester carboxylesterase